MAYTTKTYDQIKANIILNIIQNVDEVNDANVGSVLDSFVAAFSTELSEEYADLNTIYQATRINTATDDDLDQIGEIVGITRNEGGNSSGDVTFSRNSGATDSFTVSNNVLISTQPNTGETTKRFITTESKTFPTSDSYTQEFVNGIYYYKLNERLFETISSLTGTASSSSHTFIEDTDFEVSEDYNGKIFDLDNYSLLNDCETIGDWAAGTNTLTITANTSEYVQDTQSLNLRKSGSSGSDTISYFHDLGADNDLTDLKAFVSMYVDESTNSVYSTILDTITIKIGSGYNGGSGSTTNNYEFDFEASDLTSDDWKRLVLDFTEATVNNNPDITAIDFIDIQVTTQSATDALADGDLMMDFWFAADYNNYRGTVIKFLSTGTLPDTTTDFITTYTPLSIDIPVESEEIGSIYNVSVGKIIYKVSNIPNIDTVYNYEVMRGGSDAEEDDDYRDRIKSGGNINARASANAIETNVLDLDFIRSASVIDLPEKSQTDEAHVYDSSTQKFVLDYFVAQDDATLLISDTAGGTADYTKDTDYELNSDNEIDFSIGGTEPSDGATVYVDYNYDHLGNFKVLVTGVLGNLSASQISEVETVVDNVRSPGTVPSVEQPTYTSVDVTCTPTIDSSYDSTTVKENVQEAISDYITNLGIGEDVLYAGIIDVIMDVSGVTNTTVSDIGGGGTSDYTIGSEEVATPGTITVN